MNLIKNLCKDGCGEDPESYNVENPIISKSTIEYTAFAYIALSMVSESVNIRRLIDIAAIKG